MNTASPSRAPAPGPGPSATELHREARRQRSAAIGDLLLRLWASLRRPSAARNPRAPGRLPATGSACGAD